MVSFLDIVIKAYMFYDIKDRNVQVLFLIYHLIADGLYSVAVLRRDFTLIPFMFLLYMRWIKRIIHLPSPCIWFIAPTILILPDINLSVHLELHVPFSVWRAVYGGIFSSSCPIISIPASLDLKFGVRKSVIPELSTNVLFSSTLFQCSWNIDKHTLKNASSLAGITSLYY
jgi:hypothetical protein